MKFQISPSQLKLILTSINNIQSEINIVFSISSGQPNIEFIISKAGCILYWKASDIKCDETEDYFLSVSISIEKILKILSTSENYNCIISTEDDELYVNQYLSIKNCVTKEILLDGITQCISIKVPYIDTYGNTDSHIEYFSYLKNKKRVDDNRLIAIFDLKALERIIHSSLDLCNEIIFTASNNSMELSVIHMKQKIKINSPLICKTSRSIRKSIDITFLSYIKSYRRITKNLCLELTDSNDTLYLSIKPIVSNNITTELIINFI